MFLCPVSSTKLVPAFARGVNIWYSSVTHGRLITFAAARKILGEDAPRELWVRSDFKQVVFSKKKCPSCSHLMRMVTAPKWAGAYEVDVCRNCHLIWLDKDDFPAVPTPEDLIMPYGDASLVASVAHSQADVYIAQDKVANPSLIGEGPEHFWKTVPGIFGMPVEMDDERVSGIGWLTWGLGLMMLLIHQFLVSSNPAFLESWAFIPSEPLRHSGLTMLSWGFLHADWFHLASNLYFFGVFADDVELYYGPKKFLFLMVSTLLLSAVTLVIFRSHFFEPHVGISGVITAIMVNYGLIYRKSRVAFLMPYFNTWNNGFGRVIQWIRVPAYWVILGFILKDLIYYFLFELTHHTQVSHSGHLMGAFFGFVFWLLNGSPNWYYDTIPKEETPVKDRLLPYK